MADKLTADPFPEDWLKRYDYETLERIAIMTLYGGMTDKEALEELEASGILKGE